MDEIEFTKYKKKGAYHWAEVSLHPIKRNSFVAGRYNNMITLLKYCFGKSMGLKGKKILDVGCGDGVLAYMLCKRGAKVCGIDNADIAIRYAIEKTKKFDIDLRQADAYEIPYRDEEFDAVVSSDTIEHIRDVDKFLSEIYRVVKKNGYVVIEHSYSKYKDTS